MHSNNNRCPWCGRPIIPGGNTVVKNYAVTKKIVRCNHCSKPVSVSLRFRKWYFVFGFLSFALIRHPVALIICLSSFTLLYLFLVKKTMSFDLLRCDESGIPIQYDGSIYTSGYSSEIPLRKGDILPTDPHFDDPSLLTRSSPIAVLHVDHINHVIEYCFLYDCRENSSLFSSDTATVYKNGTAIQINIKREGTP